MKIKITKEEYEALSGDIKSLYQADGDDFRIDLEDMEDTGALKRAKDHEKEARKAAETRSRDLEKSIKEMQLQLDDINNDKSRKKGDIEAIEKSYQEKMNKLQQDAEQRYNSLQAALQKKAVDSEATRIATELAGPHAALLLPHIKNRLKADIEDGNVMTRVIGDDGQVTADSLDDLKNFFLANDAYAPVIIGSKATGGGAAGSVKGAGGPKRKSLNEMTATEEAKFARDNPQEYEKMLADAGVAV